MWLHVVLQRVMNARQFGLKLIANVTYGYTSAGFSGRMPMAEIADSIVQVSSPTTKTASDHHKCCIGIHIWHCDADVCHAMLCKLVLG